MPGGREPAHVQAHFGDEDGRDDGGDPGDGALAGRDEVPGDELIDVVRSPQAASATVCPL